MYNAWDAYLEMEGRYEQELVSECVKLGANENLYFYSSEIEAYMYKYEPSEAAKIFMESNLPHKIYVPTEHIEPLSDDLTFLNK